MHTTLTSLYELSHEVHTLTYLLEPFIPRVGVVSVVGMPDSGKSMFCRNLCVAIVKGCKTFVEFTLKPIHRSVLFVTSEDTREITGVTFKMMQGTISDEQRHNLKVIFSDEIGPDELLSDLEECLQEKKYDAVIIDAFSDQFRGAEGNSNIANRNTLRPFSVLAGKHETAVIFIHHTNKAAKSQAPSQLHVQGGSGFVQKVRSVLELRHSPRNANARYLFCTKGNGVPNEYKENGYELIFDEDTLTYRNTGAEIPVATFIEAKPRSNTKIRINASEIFKDEETELSRKEIAKRVVEVYKCAPKTAYHWINTELEVSTTYGYFLNPINFNQ